MTKEEIKFQLKLADEIGEMYSMGYSVCYVALLFSRSKND